MRRRLSSHRFRRRVAWLSAIVAIVAVVVGGAIKIGNTAPNLDTPMSQEKAWIYHEPRLHHLTKAERDELLDTSVQFIRTAVARHDLDTGWDLLGPEMRAGQTAREFRSGTNNVVPFPAAGIAQWSVLYSYDDDVAFDLSLIAEDGGDLVGKTFTIELKRYPQRGNRWLVASWVPNGVSGAGQSKAMAAEPPPPPAKAPLGAAWLVVPLGILGLIVLVPLVLATRSFVQHRRAAKRYERELSGFTSSSSPS
jgi:hypothetical protein